MKSEKTFYTLGLAVLAIFVFALRWILYSQTQFIADDAYITYRYAENFVAGNGLVYNPGEKVLGTTTPLLTFFLIAGLGAGIPATLFSPLLNMACDAVTALLLVGIFRCHFGRTGFGFLAGFLYAIFPSPWVWSTSGMEVSLYTLCIVASLYFFLSRRYSSSFLFLGLALLTRIDALVLMVALGMTAALAREKIGLRPWLVLILVLAPWLIAATLYYGSPVPNSLVAKKVFYGELAMFRSSPGDIVKGFILGGKTSLVSSFYSPLYAAFFVALLFCAVLGAARIFLGEKRFWALPLWAGGYVAFFILGKTHMHPWYYAPFYAVYLPLAVVGMAWIWDLVFRRGIAPSWAPGLKRVLVAAMILVSFAVITLETGQIVFWLGEYQKTENYLTGIATWLRDHSLEKDKIYYSDIGKLGYFSQRYILDSVGIISPVVTRYYRSRDWLGPIREVKPEYVLFAQTDFRLADFLADPELKKHYAEINRFDYRKSSEYTKAIYSAESSGIEFPLILVYQKRS